MKGSRGVLYRIVSRIKESINVKYIGLYLVWREAEGSSKVYYIGLYLE